MTDATKAADDGEDFPEHTIACGNCGHAAMVAKAQIIGETFDVIALVCIRCGSRLELSDRLERAEPNDAEPERPN